MEWFNDLGGLWAESVSAVLSQSDDLGTLFDPITLFLYILALKLNHKTIKLCLIAELYLMGLAETFLFDMITEIQWHLIVAALWYHIVTMVPQWRVKLLIYGLGTLNTFMAWDAYINGDIETILYNVYPSFTVLIHVLIISSFINWRNLYSDCSSACGNLVDIIRRFSYN